jgi:hypothetical protein
MLNNPRTPHPLTTVREHNPVAHDGQRMTALPSRIARDGRPHGRDLSTEDLEASISSRKIPTSRSREQSSLVLDA